jgi:hypothetical protein
LRSGPSICRLRHFDPRLIGLFRQSQPQILAIKADWDAREAQQAGAT